MNEEKNYKVFSAWCNEWLYGVVVEVRRWKGRNETTYYY